MGGRRVRPGKIRSGSGEQRTSAYAADGKGLICSSTPVAIGTASGIGSTMVRFPEGKIKEAILHPDIEIRDRAVGYFAKSFSTDTSIMPLVIKAVETYGRQNDAYRLIGASRELPQTEDTIAWVIEELNAEPTATFENYAFNLSMVLVEADPTLLLPREST